MDNPIISNSKEREIGNIRIKEIKNKKMSDKNILFYNPDLSDLSNKIININNNFCQTCNNNHSKTNDLNEFSIDKNNKSIKNNTNINFSSTLDYSNSNNSNIFNMDNTFNSIHININNKINENEKKFNPLRNKFYIDNKLYDILLNPKLTNFLPQYKITEIHFSYLYPNEIVTYPICVSGFIFQSKNKCEIDIDKSIIIKENLNIYNNNFGLCFCHKNIEFKIESEKKIIKCEPNGFICDKCMEINKNIYNIKKKYLINIIGRVSKINKGSYHCFGHFLCGNQIEDCITRFTCKGCKILNEYSKYYI